MTNSVTVAEYGILAADGRDVELQIYRSPMEYTSYVNAEQCDHSLVYSYPMCATDAPISIGSGMLDHDFGEPSQ